MRLSFSIILLVLSTGFAIADADSNATKSGKISTGNNSIAATTPAQPAQTSGKYTRLTKTGDDAYTFELAIRSFKPVSGKGSEVILISAIHIGSKEYYEELQKIIDSPALLLFEGVSDNHKKADAARTEEKRPDGLYEQFAHPLGFVTQLESLNYKRENFKNADLSMQQLQEILKKEAELENRKGEAARDALKYFEQLEKVLSGGDPFSAFILRGFFGMIGNSPQFRTMLLFHLASAEDGAKSSGMMTPGLQRIARLILHDRNKAVMDMLAEELDQPDPPASIGVFYGAAHLSGMEKILVQKMGYQFTKNQWITAYTIHPKAAGLDDAIIKSLTKSVVEKN
ncbi:MAG: TraB/GumN family protein [Puniceicoccales bacterium]|jgi:hypothetical protein|nr:TraB/GumN family protein [Puniceicoccales bacterium]